MAYILGAQRESVTAVRVAFRHYQDYLAANRGRFPPAAFELATSDWYYDFADHRCPHDGRLRELRVAEPVTELGTGKWPTITIRLEGAYGDGYIDFTYPRVRRYDLSAEPAPAGHCDWRYDEFRLTEDGLLVHEIEWAGPRATARWVIEATDIAFGWAPHDITE